MGMCAVCDKIIGRKSMTKKENYYVFKFDPENEDHDWNIDKGIRCLQDINTEFWTSPIPCSPAPQRGDKVIIWESKKLIIRGVATVAIGKEKNEDGGYRVFLGYQKLFKDNPYTERDAKNDNMLACFNEMKGRNDQRSKKLISSDFNPDKLYEILLKKRKGIKPENASKEETKDVVINEMNDKRKKEIGDIGENIVFKSEKKRLIKADKKKLSQKVENKAKYNLGYDILSFDANGEEKYIEVKSTVLSKNSSFHITKRELRSIEKRKNSWIYFVVDVDLKAKTGKIDKRLRSEKLKENYNLTPEVFKASKK